MPGSMLVPPYVLVPPAKWMSQERGGSFLGIDYADGPYAYVTSDLPRLRTSEDIKQLARYVAIVAAVTGRRAVVGPIIDHEASRALDKIAYYAGKLGLYLQNPSGSGPAKDVYEAALPQIERAQALLDAHQNDMFELEFDGLGKFDQTYMTVTDQLSLSECAMLQSGMVAITLGEQE